MSKLPPEILIQIFELANADDEFLKWTAYRKFGRMMLSTISMVCKKWKALTEPLLYRNVTLNFHSYPRAVARTEKLHKVLLQNPHRNRYIEVLKLELNPGHYAKIGEEVLTNLSLMSSLREVYFTSCDSYGPLVDPSIANQLSSMNIRLLSLDTHFAPTVLEQILSSDRDQVFPALKELHIDSHIMLKTHKEIKPYRQSTANLQTLRMGSGCPPNLVDELLKWPRALRKLDLQYDHEYTIPTLEHALTLQRKHLHSLIISSGHMYDEKTLPTLPTMPLLTTLNVYYTDVFATSAEQTARNLVTATPNLKTFEIDIEPENDEGVLRLEFEDDYHGAWLLTFATTYRSLSSDGSLENIDIRYPEDSDGEDWDEDEWETKTCVDGMRPKIEKLGMRLCLTEYSKIGDYAYY